MTRAEVEAILGPPGDYRSEPKWEARAMSGGWHSWCRPGAPSLRGDAPSVTGGNLVGLFYARESKSPDGVLVCEWESDAAGIWVFFELSGRAVDADICVRKEANGEE
jgi:hypothetical protein